MLEPAAVIRRQPGAARRIEGLVDPKLSRAPLTAESKRRHCDQVPANEKFASPPEARDDADLSIIAP
ncbi:MAG TPA: hypothetical protein VFY92_01730 [Hyphomicrobiaceae bacterium]|nr:hypothetical protein [Hyphomicrobiaceae bacterium]